MYTHSAGSNLLLAYAGRVVQGKGMQLTDLSRLPTSDDSMYRQYRVTITPHQKSADFDVKIRVKNFHDGGAPVRLTYIAPGFGDSVTLAEWSRDPDGLR